ncbi:MAG: response regulator [Acidobacteriota bacterium]|nr:MAG: response regulator [Acidobacteriota bacterium]
MYHLVLADDSKTIQKVVELSFAGEDCELFCFENGASALEHIRRRGADVVLLDLSLPVLDGYELCRELKEDPRTSSLPVIFLASAFEPFDEQRAAGIPYEGCLTKPFETSHLVEFVQNAVRRAEEEREEAARPPWEQVDENFLDLPLPDTDAELLFDLTLEECRPEISSLNRKSVVSGPAWAEGLSPEQFSVLIGEVSRRLPLALRELLPEVAHKVIKE